MYARIGTWQGTQDELDRWVVRAREHVKPSVQQDTGLTAAYWLVDRTSAATNARVTTDRYEVVDSLIP